MRRINHTGYLDVDYRRSLDYLYGLQRFGIKLGLENIRALLERLSHPEKACPLVHVGGTNGKGSASACLATILQAAGYRVGLYTSPHLHSFTERIRADRQPIAEAEVARLTEEIRRRGKGIPATFFEFTTALALRYFQERQVDFAVLEVGMGGRLDATNAVFPHVTVLTSISSDHGEHLGSDLAAIAGEKAGIIKSGVPVVCAEQEPQVLEVIRRQAESAAAPFLLCGRDFSFAPAVGGFSYRGLDRLLDRLRPGLEGAHQWQNLSLALAAAEVLGRRGAAIAKAHLRQGVAEVRWPGRLEWWGRRREILLDGAHNGGGARALAAYLAGLRPKGVRWVVGLKGDKNPGEILPPLLPLASSLYCTAPPAQSVFPPENLVRMGVAAGVAARAFSEVAAALQAALDDRREGEVVLVAGSLFLVAAVRQILQSRGAGSS